MSDTHPISIILPATRFRLGRIVATTNALDRFGWAILAHAVTRHAAGDWGNVSRDDKAANEAALVHGNRLLSAYGKRKSRVWVITEADRSATTVLLPEDY